MATRTPVLLGTSWTLIYNASATGDFIGFLQQTGGAADAIIHISTISPGAGDGGLIVDGGLSVNLTQASGLKIYGRSPSATATVCLTTNAGSISTLPATTVTGNVSSGALTQAMGATAVDISGITRSSLQLAYQYTGSPTTGTLTITGRPRGGTDYVTIYNAYGAALTLAMTAASAVTISGCNFDSIKLTPASFDGTNYTVLISGV